MKHLFTILTIFLTVLVAHGQMKRANHWYFGYQAGIDFSTSIPKSDTSGKMESLEGSCSISDTEGNLLFYSNGENVWNKNNFIMPNGKGIFGNQSSSQSSIIVPTPGNNSLYYLFTTDAITYSTRYSTIDMSLNNGLGDVTSIKNILLYNSGTEELAGTMHCNAKDYWVVGRQNSQDTLTFYSYLVNANGISDSIISKFRIANSLKNSVGFLTFSQDGKTLCFSSVGTDIYIFNFNKETGQITFKDFVSHNTNEQVYANAISPDSKKLYITSWTPYGYSLLSQFDLTASNITASRLNIDSVDYRNGSPNGYGFIGQIRLAPDQKIYVSRWNQNKPFVTNPNTNFSLDSIDVINSPNLSGLACNFKRNFLYLNHKPTEIGLPNFISNFTSLTIPTSNCNVSVNEHINFNSLEVFPNPFSINTTIQSDKFLKNASLIVYNSIGNSVKRIDNINGQTFIFYRENLPSGLYFLHIKQDNKIIATNKLVITDY